MSLLIILSIYFVSFTDKPQTNAPCLSPRAIEQRTRWNIATDELDYPVSAVYLDSLRALGATVCHTSRWFNGATCNMSEELAAEVSELGFVSDVEMTREGTPVSFYRPAPFNRQSSSVPPHPSVVNWTDEQLALYNLQPLHEAGYEGQGILMSVCDGGFYRADTMSCFRQDSLQLGHFDFTDDTDGFYGSTGVHGTECLSTISGIRDGYYGSATQAQYYLMRSEELRTESPKEMDNLVAALEKSDSLGVNIFSVSLGYAQFDNSSWDLDKTSDLDGITTRCSRAATIAARKGMLVCVAAGNDGTDAWRTLSAPADADSILTVGAVGLDSIVGSFSSYGPASDGRVKPEVCAVGVRATLIHPVDGIVRSNGTSFATPLLAGMAASLWSALPAENAMQIRERIIRSCHHYPTPDIQNHGGYGIPDAWRAYTMDSPVTGLGNVQRDDVRCTKVMENGVLYLLYEGRKYDVHGRRF